MRDNRIKQEIHLNSGLPEGTKMKRIMYRLIIVSLLLTLLIPPAQAQTPRYLSASELLPVQTLLYVEMQGAELPDSLDSLLAAFLPETLDFSLQSAFEATPFDAFSAWLGEHIAASVFLPVDMQNPHLIDYVPEAVMIFEIGDESAAGDFIDAQISTGNLESVTSSNGNRYRISMLPQMIDLQMQRLPGFFIVGTSRGLEYISHMLESRTESLLRSGTFNTVQNTLAPEPLIWVYSPFAEGGIALYADDEKISFEYVRFGNESIRVAAALRPDALQAVPMGAWFVDTAMNADTDIETALENIRRFSRIFAPLDENIENLPVLLESAPRTIAGVSLTEDIVPLFDGGYAAYVLPNIAGSTFDAALILAPEQAADVPFILTRISNRISQTTGLDVELSGQTQYTLHTASEFLPDVVYGVEDGRLYVGTSGGAVRTLIALENGQNINRDSRWLRVLESAPEGTQRITYMNLRDITDTVQLAVMSSPDMNSEALLSVLNYLNRFESLAVFSRQDTNGIQLTRLVLLLVE